MQARLMKINKIIQVIQEKKKNDNPSWYDYYLSRSQRLSFWEAFMWHRKKSQRAQVVSCG